MRSVRVKAAREELDFSFAYENIMGWDQDRLSNETSRLVTAWMESFSPMLYSEAIVKVEPDPLEHRMKGRAVFWWVRMPDEMMQGPIFPTNQVVPQLEGGRPVEIPILEPVQAIATPYQWYEPYLRNAIRDAAEYALPDWNTQPRVGG